MMIWNAAQRQTETATWYSSGHGNFPHLQRAQLQPRMQSQMKTILGYKNVI